MDIQLSKILDQVLDADFGIIRFIKEAPLSVDEPEICIAVTEFQDPFLVTSADRTNYKMERKAAGAALDRETAIWSAVGEGLERYAGAIYDPEMIIWEKSSSFVKESVVHPNEFILFSEEQYKDPTFKYNAHDPQKPIGWTMAQCLTTHKKVWFPAALAYFAYKHEAPTEYITDTYSTGLACGPTKAFAIRGGLCEVIERDAYALHWAAKLPAKRIPKSIAIEHANPQLKKLIEFNGVDLFIGDITTEIGIPTIISIAKQKGKPGLALGASTNLCTVKALEKAVIECFHTLNWCQEMRQRSTEIKEEEVQQFSDHVKYYLNKENESKASFFWSGDEVSSLFDSIPKAIPKEQAKQCNIMATRLSDLGYASYVIDTTTDDIRDLGLYVTKTVVPGLQPMWCGYNRVPLDRRRFDKFLKFKKLPINTPINTQIHPFP